MPTGSTISRTDAAAKPRCAKARAASSSRRGRRLDARRVGAAGRGRAAGFDGGGSHAVIRKTNACLVKAGRADDQLARARRIASCRRRPPPPCSASAPAPPDALERADIPWLARARGERAGARPRRPEGGEGRARRAALPRRPAGDLLVRRHRRPAQDQQRHRDGHPDHLHRPAAGRLVRRRHGDQARGLPLQHRGAAAEHGRRPHASTPSTGCSTAASRSTASSCSSSTSGSASSWRRARSTA